MSASASADCTASRTDGSSNVTQVNQPFHPSTIGMNDNPGDVAQLAPGTSALIARRRADISGSRSSCARPIAASRLLNR